MLLTLFIAVNAQYSVRVYSKHEGMQDFNISANDSGLRFGARIGGNVNQYILWDFIGTVDWDVGYGFDGGLAVKYPLTDRLSLNSEVSFCYRVLGNYAPYRLSDFPYHIKNDDGDLILIGNFDFDFTKISLSEMAVLVPVMIQFIPVRSVPLHVSAGIQLGFPFNNKYKETVKVSLDGENIEEYGYNREEDDDGNRSFIDFGAALGIGYMATPNLSIDFRFIFNLNPVYDSNDYITNTLMYFTLGVSYFL
jgi:hypothetical protein